MTPGALPLPPFAERFPWIGGDLQTIRNRLLPPQRPGFDTKTSQIELPTSDHGGDRLIASVDRPATPSGPTVLLIHGLAGSAGSRYMRASARHLVALGHPVVRLNLRGAGPSAATCRQRYHAGRAQDLRDAIAGLPVDLTGQGICAIGYSLGGNTLLKLLGESGGDTPIRAAVSVSAPIDLAQACSRIDAQRNWLYQAHLLSALKGDARAVASSPSERASIGSIREFDERVTAPANGFRGAADYYAACSAIHFVERIAVPTWMIYATNDPWVPDAPYRRLETRRSDKLRVSILAGGGHVGFHGRGSTVAWHDLAAASLFAGTLAGRRLLEPKGNTSVTRR